MSCSNLSSWQNQKGQLRKHPRPRFEFMFPADLTQFPQTDPLEIYRLRDGLYGVDLLGAAVVHFDFFSWLAEHPSDKATICRELQIVERPTDVMLTLFTALGLIESKDGIFHTTALAREHLVRT